MNKLWLYAKVVQLFLTRKVVTQEDIGRSYSLVSANYARNFLETMHRYNDEMILELRQHLGAGENLNVLDLAAGTGYNSVMIAKAFPGARITLVDISTGMLDEARKNLNENACFVADDMLHYLEKCDDCVFDMIICGWAIKYQPPLKIIRQCRRVLKQGGCLAVIVNTKDTLPQVRRIYPRLLEQHRAEIHKLMMNLPNPKDLRAFDNWFSGNSFTKVMSKEGFHDFIFKTSEELTAFLTSTGALAGFDVMIDLRDPDIQADMARLLREQGLLKATHTYVYGIYQKD